MGGGFRGQRRPPKRFSSPLGAWGPRPAAAGPGLHQSDGGRVWLHASGLLSPSSGPSTVQGPGLGAAQEVPQPGEALAWTSKAPSPAPGGRCSCRGLGGGSAPSLGRSEEQSRLPVSQHVGSLLANHPNARSCGASPHPPVPPLVAGHKCRALALGLCPQPS